MNSAKASNIETANKLNLFTSPSWTALDTLVEIKISTEDLSMNKKAYQDFEMKKITSMFIALNCEYSKTVYELI